MRGAIGGRPIDSRAVGAIDVELRWTDVDMYGHVHHVAVIALAEHARSQWLDAVLEVEQTWDYVIARLAFDYRSPLLWHERFARIAFAPGRIGGSSITLRETVSAPDGRVVAEGECVIVAWDVEHARSRPLAAGEIARLERVS